MNKHIGFIACDFMAILALGLLIFMNQPKKHAVQHKVTEPIANSALIREINGTYQIWKKGQWSKLTDTLDKNLLVLCDEKARCLNWFSATSHEATQLVIVLPEFNKQTAAELLYSECAINKRCTNLIITHSSQSIDINQVSN